MLDELIAGLDAHDAALTAAALRRGGAAPFAQAPTVYYALLRSLEAVVDPDPPRPGAPAPVVVLEEVRAARASTSVEGQGSPYRPVRSLCESPHYLKAGRS